MKTIPTLLATILFILTKGFAEEHEWTNLEGRTIHAEFVSATNEDVTLLVGGRTAVVALSDLSPASIELAAALAASGEPQSTELFVQQDPVAEVPPDPSPVGQVQPEPEAVEQFAEEGEAAVAAYSPPPAIGSAKSDLSFKTYRLSYMQSDRVLALLKALGYSTVEYTAEQGEVITDAIYSTFTGEISYPMVIKLIDASKTSLFQPALDGGVGAEGSMGSTLGGTYLHTQTTGAPEQRLFIVYEKAFPEQIHALIQLLQNEIDVPAMQVVIEALVVEIDTDKVEELGMNYNLQRNDYSLNLSPNSANQLQLGGRYEENELRWDYLDDEGYSIRDPIGLTANISAFVQDGHAEILSNPSVLVLDGRQARIQVGTQIPNQTTYTNQSYASTSVEYLQTGIVLNIRPRVSEDGSEVTMQVETIVSSSVSATSPPEIDNRQVQTFVRVADNTPFIVGGLINKDEKKSSTGVPILSDIPLLGNLFKKKKRQSDQREVIIVLTPHVIGTKEKSFSYVIPKDSKTFDSFDNMLFRNAYRIRDDDLFDLSFATQSKYYLRILESLKAFGEEHLELAEEPIFGYLEDKVPGEEVIVRRMIWEIVHKSKYHDYISSDHILIFESNEEAEYGNKFKTLFLHNLMNGLNEKDRNSLILDYADHKTKTTGPFEHPRALVKHVGLKDPSDYVKQISLLNASDPDRNTILLSGSVSPPGVRGATALEVLKGVLVLKRILALNSSMPVTIKEFRVGRQIIFPTEQELRDKYHVVDYDAARFFYEIINYYPEFERAFNDDAKGILDRMEELNRR